MGADDNPDYEVNDLPDDNPDGGDHDNGDDTSRAADTSRSTATGAPNGQPGSQGNRPGQPNGQRPGSTSSAGSSTGAGAQVPSGLLREANRRVRVLEREVQRLREGGTRPNDNTQQQPPRRQEPSWTPEQLEIREQLFSVAPFLRKLEQLDPEQLERVLTGFDGAVQQGAGLEKLYWQRIGSQHLREVETQVKAAYGDQVHPRAVRQFQAGFLDWIETDPDARERYLDGDPTLVADYWKETSGLIVEPIRTKASSDAVTRAERVNRLPQMPRRGGPIGQPRRSEKKPKTDDELHDQAWDALVERSGAIGR